MRHGDETSGDVSSMSTSRRGQAEPTGCVRPPECVSCRLDAELVMGGVWLCLSCYHVAGSTCAGVWAPSDVADTEVC